ncbi:divalent-cation tolerance protein CutA [Antribacter sp. KLBMP9083]|uniref:Divalent-cation tolerance protein CutA n=1 Tax=Antribacter soli TaxID=2910976 RepID=A0AA41U7A0_9MICO|nr:divalent-cation tolerance protein CutA [Antribacter soli]MCF4121336.1 divalent-cation tolerance protein CutA [Antribacter soli]
MDPVLVQVTTTFDDEAAALEMADGAVQARLAACAQIEGPITAIYRWQGQVHREREWRLVLKTRPQLTEALVLHIRALHTYDLPEIVVTPIIGGSPEYLAWAAGEAETTA